MNAHASYIEDGLRGYAQVLQAHGPAGLDFLNARVEHRFTCVFRLDAGTLYNVYLHDKLGTIVPEYLRAVPLGESFCQFVLREGMFCAAHTAQDARLDGHKYQGVMGAYYGVPLLDNAGDLYGTLCHLDPQGLELPQTEFALLQKAAQVLPKYLRRKKFC